jgi:type VI secretion system protein ImpG
MLRYYERELRHVRESAGEFAREFPKIASRLGLDGLDCADPYVERLLEGFAFLAARVQLKLDAEFPRFTQHLLESVYPHYLSPTPSMLVAQFQPDLEDSGLASGFTIPRDTALRSAIGKDDQTACEYRTAHEITLWPLELVEAQYHDRDLPSLGLPAESNVRAAVRIRLRATAGLNLNEIEIDKLTLYLRGMGDIPSRIYEQIFAHGVGALLRPTTKPAKWHHRIDMSHVRQVGFGADEALLPPGPRSFDGYRNLHEYFAFPERFMFVEVSGLGEGFARSEQTQFELLILLDQPDVELESAVSKDNFLLHSTPAINLFQKRADRIHISDKFPEFHLVPDRTRPLDFEIYDVGTVTGFGTTPDDETEFRPFYAASDYDERADSLGAYFSTNRVPRALSAREKRHGRRSSYTGSEIYLSLVDAHNAPYLSDLRQIGATVRCSNRDLPLRMPVGTGRTDFTTEAGAAVDSIRCVGGPTPPHPSHAEGETAWRLISHLSLNYLSIADEDETRSAAAMRELLSLYGNLADSAVRKQIEGVRKVGATPISRRVPTPGPIAFARGLEVGVLFEDAAFQGSGPFVLGAVLERFFAKYVSLNSFTETVIRTSERGEIKRWPTRIGLRHTL